MPRTSSTKLAHYSHAHNRLGERERLSHFLPTDHEADPFPFRKNKSRTLGDGKLYAFLTGMKPAVFIERDGILNSVGAVGRQQICPETLDRFHVKQEVVPLLQELRAAGLMLIVTTNQPGLSRGSLSRRELDRMHQVLRSTFILDDVLVCPHEDGDRCPCRKPKAGLFKEAAYKFGIDLNRSFVISDKWQDAEAARRIGATSLLVHSPWLGDGHHDFILPDLATLVDKVLQLNCPHSLAAS